VGLFRTKEGLGIWNISSSLIAINCNYYIIYYNKRIIVESYMEENGEAAEVVSVSYFKRLMQ
jgi:hypothetical protein